MAVEMGDDVGNDGGADEGPGAVMDEHEVGFPAAQRLEPARHRGLARRAAGDRAGQGQVAHRLVVERPVVLADDHLDMGDSRMSQEGLDSVAQHRLAADPWYCLGRSPPARTPAPAATMTAAADMGDAPGESGNRGCHV
jgi:hypothetical protein